MIDLVITATLRPELLKITLDTHYKYLFKDRTKDINLIMNIDCLGVNSTKEQQKKIGEIFKIIDQYNFRSDDIYISNEPHFGRAFCRCMKKTQSEFVFNLEEDWQLLYPVDFERMIELMENEEKLVHLRLSAFSSENGYCKNWNRFLFWNGKYFQVPEDLKGTIGWAGHPSLNKGQFMRDCLYYMNPEHNPEKQIKGRNPYIGELIRFSNFGSFHEQNKSAAIKDIGRQWMIKNGWKKSGSKAFFTKWERS
jgi:hypothetical protein